MQARTCCNSKSRLSRAISGLRAITSSLASARAAKRSKEAKRSNIEIERHDDRMKSARYKLEAFIRDYSDMAEWKKVIEAVKTQLGAKHV
jgi:CHAD domain-containing protein